MRQLRLSFLTSKVLMDIGGSSAVEDSDFKAIIEPNLERMSLDFLIEALEQHMGNLKPEEHYKQIVQNDRQVASLSEYNQRNIAQLHLDEQIVLEKNL